MRTTPTTLNFLGRFPHAHAILILGLLLFGPAARTETPVAPPGRFYTSWLGNSYMDSHGKKNVTEELNDVCVSPNGHVFTAGYAETWGGGASYQATKGDFIARYDRFETGFGDPVSCVTADDRYVYFGSGKGILRAHHGGSQGPYETFLAGTDIQGLFVTRGKVYVSDFGGGTIRVINSTNMVEERNWPCPNPTRLTVDAAGSVWVVIYSPTSPQTPSGGPMWWGDKVRSFSPEGIPGPEITDFEKPLSVAVNRSGQLLVGGLNEHSQLWLYDVAGTPSKIGTFGADKGIFAGPIPGAFSESARLHWIRAIAIDADDNIYTGCCYGTFWGGCIEKWDASESLLWRAFAGTSLDCAGIDPDRETEVYSKYHHYSLDYSKTTPGTEWSLKGFTVNRFKYPNDPRVDQNTDVGSRSLGAGAYRIGGKLFVARSSQEGYRWELYRQEPATEGEVLVPSVVMGAGGDSMNQFYNPTTKTWYLKPKKDNLYNQYWCIARNGDLLTIADNPDQIIHYKYGGLDTNSNPIWEAATATATPAPELSNTRKPYYDSEEDVMTDGRLVGTLVQDVANGWHGSQGQVDAAYALTATRRSNGEYVLLFENAAWANIMMQRWCPDGDCF